MIAAFSTSSPLASVALVLENGELLAEAQELAPRAAGGACLFALERMFDSTGTSLKKVSLFVADVGPGSFTGVRVAVTLAKAMGYASGKPVAAVTSFDLILPDAEVAVAPKRGEYVYRKSSGEIVRTGTLPTSVRHGYGDAFSEPRYPCAGRVAAVLARLRPMPPEELLPLYVAPPSISTPKRPFPESGPVNVE